MSRDWKEPRPVLAVLLLSVVTLACLVPFLGKAFHIDDPLFVWTALQIHAHPLDFYGFKVLWSFEEKPMFLEMQNPPLASYYMAGVGGILGWSEKALHGGFLVPALALVLGSYRLARRFCAHPFAAALATFVTPVVLLSSTSVMCDVMMTALWVWAICLWLEGIEAENGLKAGETESFARSDKIHGNTYPGSPSPRPSPAGRGGLGEEFCLAPRFKLALSTVLICACVLTKYFGLSLVPLLAAHTFLKRRRAGWWLLYFAAPVLVLLAYQWWTGRLYGNGLVSNASQYAVTLRYPVGWLSRIIETLSFSGGCLLVVLAALPLLLGRKGVVAALVGAGVAVALMSLMKRVGECDVVVDGHVRWVLLAHVGVFMTGGAAIVWLGVTDAWRNRTPDSIFLLLWLMGVLVFVGAINWTVSARNILPLAPVVALLLVRRLEFLQLACWRTLFWPLAISLGVALAVTWADWRFANSARDVARALFDKVAPTSNGVTFEGHWGFQYYLQQCGLQPLQRNPLVLSSNEAVLVPLGNSCIFDLPEDRIESRSVVHVTPADWISVHSYRAGAGFYSDGWGPAPFVFGPATPDAYWVFKIK